MKPPIVLLHGLTGSGACWALVARALENDFDVVTPDARGHGRPLALPGPLRYEDLAADVIGLLDAMGPSEPVLLGHSMGGMTALVVASQRRVRKLVLVDPTFLSPERQREVWESDAAEQHRRSLGLSKSEVMMDLRKRHPHRAPELVESIATARLGTDNRAFDILRPPNPDCRTLVGNLAVPTMLVIGDVSRGAVVSRDVADELALLNPYLRIEPIVGAGHAIPYDHPERLAELVRSFALSGRG